MEAARGNATFQGRAEEKGAVIWRDWGGSGPLLHFAHANGFPPGTYRKLITDLSQNHHVVSMAGRPLWRESTPTVLHDWSLFADDLRTELDRRSLRGVIGVGHSLGGVISLLAAAADPGIFSAVVAVDPLILTGVHSAFWGAVKKIGMAERIRLVRGARRRRDVWDDRDQARTNYGRKSVFAGWDPEVLDDYLEAGLVEQPGGGERLRYPREWEARIFAAAPHNLWRQLKKVTVPTLFVQGEHTDTFVDAARIRVEREVPGARTVVVPGSSHFLPMECPRELARVIDNFLGALKPEEDQGEAGD